MIDGLRSLFPQDEVISINDKIINKSKFVLDWFRKLVKSRFPRACIRRVRFCDQEFMEDTNGYYSSRVIIDKNDKYNFVSYINELADQFCRCCEGQITKRSFEKLHYNYVYQIIYEVLCKHVSELKINNYVNDYLNTKEVHTVTRDDINFARDYVNEQFKYDIETPIFSLEFDKSILMNYIFSLSSEIKAKQLTPGNTFNQSVKIGNFNALRVLNVFSHSLIFESILVHDFFKFLDELEGKSINVFK